MWVFMSSEDRSTVSQGESKQEFNTDSGHDQERFLEAKRGQAHRDATSFTDLLGD